MDAEINIPATATAAAKQTISLKRGIGKWSLVLLVINSVIGAGIFGLPSKIFGLSGMYSLLAFAACAVVIMVFVFCFAEVASQFDKTGGPYVYVLAAFGRFPAFIMGWLLLLSRIFNYATLINLLVIYLSYFSATFSQPAIRACCIISITVFFGYINYIGVKNTVRVNNILTIAKLLPLTAFIVTGLYNINPQLLSHSRAFQMPSFTHSVLLLVFAFGGFEGMLVNSAEIEKPQKNIPFALVTAAIVVAVYYCLIQLVSIGTLPALAASEKPLADAADNFMGPAGGSIMAIGALVSVTSTLNGLVLSGSRLPYALSLEKQLPPFLSYVHPKYRTPAWSLLALLLIIAVVSLAWSFFAALATASIVRVLVYFMVCASLIKLRRQKKAAASFYKLRYGILLAIAGMLIAAWLLTASKQSEAIAVSACIIIGLVLYISFNRRRKKTFPGQQINKVYE
ncbi:MAG TPA: APC family permease [Parafilimonas sp.]|nr:APC family permease [Parafilimonas sp.]